MKILFVGPVPPPVTGQAICFKKIIDQYTDDEKIVINNSRYSNKIVSTIYVYVRIIFILVSSSRKINRIYLTCSRSLPGFVKDFPVLLLGRLLNVKIINHLHGSDFISFEKKFPFKKLLHWLYEKVESVVLLEQMKEQFSSFSNMKIWTVPNFYDAQLNVYDNTVEKRKGQILFLSNLMKSKGILEFIDNAEEILSNQECSIIIAGSYMGDKYMSEKEIKTILEPRIQELAAKYKDRFTYKGFVQGEAKVKLLASSDAFILPSYTEGFPISIIEAMRLGCVIFTTDVDYLTHIISNKNGAIIPIGDLKNISKYIELEFSNPDTVKEKQCYNFQYAKENYSEEKYISNLQQIINEQAI